MAIDLLADTPEGIDLLADEPTIQEPSVKNRSFYDLSKEDQAKAMALARQQISQQYPNMPDWLRDMMLSVTPKDQSPRLQKIANEAQADTNGIPVVAGGLMQGFATPFQGVASLIPGKTAEDFSNEDFTNNFPKPQNDTEKAMQTGAEFLGGLGPVGKLFGMLKGGTKLAGIPKALQNASALAGTGAIATPGDAMNKALGATGALALGAGGKVASQVGQAVGTKVPAFLRGLTNDSTSESLAKAVQKPHDILSNTAEQLYNYVRGAIKKRNLTTPVSRENIYHAEAILPKTRAVKEMLYNAKLGDYDSVHDLQSHLYKTGTAGITSDDIVSQNQGHETLDLRNKINEDLKNNLMQSGHVDIAHVLDQGKSVYKKLMNTYFDKNLPKGIGKMVQSDLRLVPKNPEKIFQQDSVPMRKFLKGHPEVDKHTQGLTEKKAAKKALGKIFGTTAKVGGTAYLGKSLFDFLS